MSRANDGGWDFVKVGEVYQYKEDWLVGMFEVIEISSDEEFYGFKLRPLLTNTNIGKDSFDISHSKDPGGMWSGMQQLYETPEYINLPIGTPWKYDYRTEEEKDNKIGELIL